MTQTLILNDYEAILIEQALRQVVGPCRPREPLTDSDILAIRSIADRLLRGVVTPMGYDHGEEPLAQKRSDAWNKMKQHLTERQSDEYACSCGARWDVADGSEHP